MSKKRQTSQLAPNTGPIEIVPFARDYDAAHVIAIHRHDKDQLVYASQGVMTVQTGMGMWVIPTHRAVWIPAGVDHGITMAGKVAMRTLYFPPGLVRRLPRTCCVVNVPPLLRELILYACTHPADGQIGDHGHLAGLILDRLEAIQALPLQLPALSDPRARRVAERISADSDDDSRVTLSIDAVC